MNQSNESKSKSITPGATRRSDRNSILRFEVVIYVVVDPFGIFEDVYGNLRDARARCAGTKHTVVRQRVELCYEKRTL